MSSYYQSLALLEYCDALDSPDLLDFSKVTNNKKRTRSRSSSISSVKSDYELPKFEDDEENINIRPQFLKSKEQSYEQFFLEGTGKEPNDVLANNNNNNNNFNKLHNGAIKKYKKHNYSYGLSNANSNNTYNTAHSLGMLNNPNNNNNININNTSTTVNHNNNNLSNRYIYNLNNYVPVPQSFFTANLSLTNFSSTTESVNHETKELMKLINEGIDGIKIEKLFGDQVSLTHEVLKEKYPSDVAFKIFNRKFEIKEAIEKAKNEAKLIEEKKLQEKEKEKINNNNTQSPKLYLKPTIKSNNNKQPILKKPLVPNNAVLPNGFTVKDYTDALINLMENKKLNLPDLTPLQIETIAKSPTFQNNKVITDLIRLKLKKQGM